MKFITHNGRTETMAEWARISGVEYATLQQRLKYGWPIDRALNPKIDGRKG